MAKKNISRSPKVIDIWTGFGHSISYTTIEKLETELTLAESNREHITPIGMNLKTSLATGVTFDNFDRFVETLNGKNTIGCAYKLSTEEIENSDKNTAFPEKTGQ